MRTGSARSTISYRVSRWNSNHTSDRCQQIRWYFLVLLYIAIKCYLRLPRSICPSLYASKPRSARMMNTEAGDNRQGWANPCCVEFQTFRWGVVPRRANQRGPRQRSRQGFVLHKQTRAFWSRREWKFDVKQATIHTQRHSCCHTHT